MTKIRFLASMLAVLVPIAVCSAARVEEEGPAPPETIEIATSFLPLLDDGKYNETWDALATPTKNIVNKESWASLISTERKRFGTLVSRKFESAQSTGSVRGAPDGQYVLVNYRSAFSAKKGNETVTLTRDEDGKWRVFRYEIRLIRKGG